MAYQIEKTPEKALWLKQHIEKNDILTGIKMSSTETLNTIYSDVTG